MTNPAPFLSDTTGVKEYYIDGFDTGINWKHSYEYVPGGPFVCKKHHNPSPEWDEYCVRTARRHQAWLLGWKHGASSNGFKLATEMMDPAMHQSELDEILLHVIRSGHPSTLTMVGILTSRKLSIPSPSLGLSPAKKFMLDEIQALEERIVILKKAIMEG